jgi:hypothetical protein
MMELSSLNSALIGALIGGIVALSLNAIAKAWHHAKETNHYRLLMLSFIDRIGIRLTQQFTEECRSAIEIIQCNRYEDYQSLITGKKSESFPMLNSDLLRSIPMAAYRDMLYGRTHYVEIFTFYHCFDFMLELTPIKAYNEYATFIKDHTTQKAVHREAFINEFETCSAIESQRKVICSKLQARIHRAELNITFMQEIERELKGNGCGWRLRYFWKALF